MATLPAKPDGDDDLRVSRALASLARSMISKDYAIDDLALDVLAHARAITGSEHGYVSEIDPITKENVGYTLTEMMGNSCLISGTQKKIRFSPRPDGSYPMLWGYALNTKESFFTNDPAAHAASHGTPGGHIPITAFLTVPVLFGGELVGQIALANPQFAYTPDDLGRIEPLAEVFAIAIHRRREAERKQALEQHVKEAQKLEALGQLTGGVAHDFNNLLGIIRGNLELLQDATSNPRRQWEVLREVLEAVESGSALTRRLLAFSRRQPLSARPSDLDQLVSNLEELFRRTLGEKIEVRHRASPGLWVAEVDPHELEHVLLNLVLNARDAMPDGGVLSIDTSNATLDEEYSSQFEEVTPGDYVLLTVSDTGMGMTPQVLDRAFDPFFTTKKTGKGSGLGLSVAYGFVKQSRGHIRLYSEAGHGTTVKLYLPRAGASAPTIVAPEHEVRASTASARILVVEDNPRLRKMSVAMLSGDGYAVAEAGDGREALLRLEDAGPFQLMITDVGLPGGMNGAEVAAVARMRQPNLHVLFMSGYAEPAVLQNQDDCTLICKPFGRNELLAVVGSLLSGDRAEGGAEKA